MGETTLKFVHGLGVVAVTIHEPHGWDANLAGIACVLDVLGLLLGTPSEPFQGDVRMAYTVLLTTDGFTGNAVRDHPVRA